MGEGGARQGHVFFVVHAGKAEFDCFIEFLGGGEVDAEFEAGLGVLVVAGLGFDG